MLMMARKKTAKPRTADRHVDRNMVSLPGDMYRQLKTLADRNGRPVSWEIRLLIKKHLEANQLWPPTSDDQGDT